MKQTTIKIKASQTQKEIENQWKKVKDKISKKNFQFLIQQTIQHPQIIRLLEGNNNDEEGRIDDQTDIKKEKKYLAELISGMKIA